MRGRRREAGGGGGRVGEGGEGGGGGGGGASGPRGFGTPGVREEIDVLRKTRATIKDRHRRMNHARRSAKSSDNSETMRVRYDRKLGAGARRGGGDSAARRGSVARGKHDGGEMAMRAERNCRRNTGAREGGCCTDSKANCLSKSYLRWPLVAHWLRRRVSRLLPRRSNCCGPSGTDRRDVYKG
jgi:hypothetical protein